MIKLEVASATTNKMSIFQNSWTSTDVDQLIEVFEIDANDLSDEEKKEYLFMAISELPVDESAYLILKYKLGEDLSEGQLQNLSNEMEDDKMWEEYPDIRFHKAIFEANQFLYEAYNGKLHKGEIIEIKCEVICKDNEISDLILSNDADVFLRIISSGMDDHSILQRLYDFEIEDEYIEDAESIIWESESKRLDTKNTFEVIIRSSSYWLHSFDEQNLNSVIIYPDTYKTEDPIED